MLDDLKAWEVKPPKDTPTLLVVSAGSVEENRALGLRAPIVLDPNFNIGRSYGATSTPSAVLIDAQGKITSEVAVGAAAVLVLATAAPTPNSTATR
jgi:hypothetical protein